MPLQAHQLRAAEQFVKLCTNTGMLLWHRMGTGKTTTVLATLMNYPHDRVLLLLPRALKNVWMHEIEQKFQGNVPFQMQMLDYDTFFNKQKQQQVKAAIHNASLVVADEAHHLTENSNMSLRLLHSKRCLLLTGTPIYHSLSDLAVLVNIAAGSNVLPYSTRQLEHLINTGNMLAHIQNYVQFYDFAADPQSHQHVIYPSVRIVRVTVNKHVPLPKKGSIVYSQHTNKLRALAEKLTRAHVPTLYLRKHDDHMLHAFATGEYVLLLDPAVAEGVTIPHARVLHVLEPVQTYGLQEQLYARVKRPVLMNTAEAKTKPMHTIFQYVQSHQDVNDVLVNLVRKLKQQMAQKQTSAPTCGLQVRDCAVWKSKEQSGTCAVDTNGKHG